MKKIKAKIEKILVCEDTSDIRLLIRRLLEDNGYDVTTCKSGEECLDLYRMDFSIVILDVNLPGMDGLSVLEKLRNKNPDLSVVIITAFSSINQTVKAMKLGAKNYIKKPFENAAFLASIRECLNEKGAVIPSSNKNFLIKTNSPTMLDMFETIKKIAAGEINVVILGESGTGKEHIARYIHELSKRKDGNYVTIDCPAIPNTLFESEMFGHVAGAFTGAKNDKEGRLKRAHNGTVFFDEVADLSLDAQAKLLRSIQEREFEPLGSTKKEKVDIRIISATSKSFASEMENQNFRSDLYYRLAEVEIRIPSLRDRKEDIPLFIEYFSNQFAEKNKTTVKSFSLFAIKQLTDYDWPGNVRELKSLVNRCLIMADEGVKTIDSIPKEYLFKTPLKMVDNEARISTPQKLHSKEQKDHMTLRSHEEIAILKALDQCNNNITHAAKLLKIGRTTLYRKMKQMKLKNVG